MPRRRKRKKGDKMILLDFKISYDSIYITKEQNGNGPSIKGLSECIGHQRPLSNLPLVEERQKRVNVMTTLYNRQIYFNM